MTVLSLDIKYNTNTKLISLYEVNLVFYKISCSTNSTIYLK